MDNKLRIILTGATGMVGEGVLLESLENPGVEQVLSVSRKPSGITHPKLKEVLADDFFDLSAVEAEFKGYNACFFCLGISSVGVSREQYLKVTYELTMHFALVLAKYNTDMTFNYISGAGTSENSIQSWAKVKASVENDLQKLPFKNAFGFRPGFIKPLENQKKAHAFYKYINWLFPIGRKLSPGSFCTMQELASAMAATAKSGYHSHIIDGKDILVLAKKENAQQ